MLLYARNIKDQMSLSKVRVQINVDRTDHVRTNGLAIGAS